MSKGTDKKSDTVQHMIARLTSGAKVIEEFISKRFEFSIVKKVYITRHLSRPCYELLETNDIRLFDKKYMWDNVWTDNVKTYASRIGIEWICDKGFIRNSS
eukprot:TRINITY_DN712_c0_g1_i3.p1 TRINITY_DN712_c0_g1~~TRINITY_DN712_c0_g1_i3.p1  ORF type:complete len:101 (-),score=12.96 TRINITY_DN712_c0_g1_i3:172-474(-)